MWLSRGNPNIAFYINSSPRKVVINYYLDRYRVHIDTESDVERRMLSGMYEKDTTQIIRRLVKRDAICLDIGANVGAITLALADTVGTGGKVLAFEPGPTFFSRLERNISENPDMKNRVVLQNVALSGKSGTIQWQLSDTGSTATTSPDGMSPHSPTIDVTAVRMDDLPLIRELPRLDFIKIDVDGLEFEILRGGRSVLERHKPIIYTETNMWNEAMKESARQLELLLLDLKYQLFRIDAKSLDLIPTSFPDFSFNTVALPRQ
ncbi:MAG TPA: FkbM family methyltransferase [Bdellovibrionota bacterium]